MEGRPQGRHLTKHCIWGMLAPTNHHEVPIVNAWGDSVRIFMRYQALPSSARFAPNLTKFGPHPIGCKPKLAHSGQHLECLTEFGPNPVDVNLKLVEAAMPGGDR